MCGPPCAKSWEPKQMLQLSFKMLWRPVLEGIGVLSLLQACSSPSVGGGQKGLGWLGDSAWHFPGHECDISGHEFLSSAWPYRQASSLDLSPQIFSLEIITTSVIPACGFQWTLLHHLFITIKPVDRCISTILLMEKLRIRGKRGFAPTGSERHRWATSPQPLCPSPGPSPLPPEPVNHHLKSSIPGLGGSRGLFPSRSGR